MKNEKYYFYIDLIMILVLVIVLIIGLGKTMLGLKDINYYENRRANKISDVSIDGFWNGESQDAIELAFADQIPMADTMKKKYNYYTHLFINDFYKFYGNFSDEMYINLGDIYKIRNTDYLVWKKKNREDIIDDVDKRITNINEICKKYPQLDFYLYFIERDMDIDFETNEKLGMYEYIDSKLSEDNIVSAKFSIDSFDEYKEYFYKTDHHWNYKGAYRGYKGLCKLMGIEEDILVPTKTFKMNHQFSGSKASTTGLSDIYLEDFVTYDFDIPEHKTYDQGWETSYGRREECAANLDIETYYGHFYGWDSGEVMFDFNRSDRDNVLFIGESFDNPILELMASHFNKTYAVDLRNYEKWKGTKFSFKEYIQKNEIDKVVLIGNVDYYIMDEFRLEE